MSNLDFQFTLREEDGWVTVANEYEIRLFDGYLFIMSTVFSSYDMKYYSMIRCGSETIAFQRDHFVGSPYYPDNVMREIHHRINNPRKDS